MKISVSEKMLNLAIVPVISDQLVYGIVNKERNFDQVDVHLFVKKCLDLLAVKNAAEVCFHSSSLLFAQIYYATLFGPDKN